MFVCVSYRVELLHLLLQHAGDHPDEAPVFEFTGLLVKVTQQRSHRGAFTVQMGVPVHPPVMKTNTHANTDGAMRAARSKQESRIGVFRSSKAAFQLCVEFGFICNVATLPPGSVYGTSR